MYPGSFEYFVESSQELFELWEKGLISPDDEEFNEFQILREIAYIQHMYGCVSILTDKFMWSYQPSFAREYTLANEIDLVNEKILHFKTNWPIIYADVLNGNDGRNTLSFEDIKAVFGKDYNAFPEQPLSQHMELLVYIKYLDLLQWIGNTENKALIEDYRDYIREQKKSLRWPVVKEYRRLRQLIDKASQTNQVSYTWLNNPDTELPRLHKLMKDKQLIDRSTKLEQLQAVFSAKPLNNIELISWIRAKNLLAYFIDRIQNKNKIVDPNLWSIAEKCFTKSKDLLQSRNNYERVNKNNKPRGFEIIDDILIAL
jgi:outer membrane lipoprotein-sorting protein